jgi:hypothetical protein
MDEPFTVQAKRVLPLLANRSGTSRIHRPEKLEDLCFLDLRQASRAPPLRIAERCELGQMPRALPFGEVLTLLHDCSVLSRVARKNLPVDMR